MARPRKTDLPSGDAPPACRLTGRRGAQPLLELCRRIAREVPLLRYAGTTIRLHRLHFAYSPAGMRLKQHSHGFHEGMWMLRGRGSSQPGARQTLRAGRTQLHQPHAAHDWRAVTATWRLVCWFSIVNQPPAAGGGNPPFNIKDIHGLFDEAESAAPGRRDRLAARLTLLMAPMLDRMSWPETETEPNIDPPSEPVFMERVDRFFEENLAHKITLSDLAQAMNMSVPTLTRTLRRVSGESVMHRLHALRMRRASQLLQQGAASTKEIGAWVGIPEPAYFHHCFRRHFGRTPREWRLQSGRDATVAMAPPIATAPTKPDQ